MHHFKLNIFFTKTLYFFLESCARIETCADFERCPMALYLNDSMTNSEDPEKQTESKVALAKKKCFIPQPQKSNKTEEGFCCSKTQEFLTNDADYKVSLLSKFSKLLCNYINLRPSKFLP